MKGRQSARDVGMEIRPHTGHDLLEMSDQRQHREHRLHEQAVLPLPPLTQGEIGWLPLGGMESGITQDDMRASIRGSATRFLCSPKYERLNPNQD